MILGEEVEKQIKGRKREHSPPHKQEQYLMILYTHILA